MEAGTDVKVMLSRSATRRALLPQSGFGERGDGSLGGEGLIVSDPQERNRENYNLSDAFLNWD